MFSDPQAVTINAVSNTLPRVSVGVGRSEYVKDDGNVKLSIVHQYASRVRRTVRLDFRKVAADPFTPSVNQEFAMSAYLVINTPKTGFTNTEVKQIVDALTAYLTASSGANVTKVIGGES